MPVTLGRSQPASSCSTRACRRPVGRPGRAASWLASRTGRGRCRAARMVSRQSIRANRARTEATRRLIVQRGVGRHRLKRAGRGSRGGADGSAKAGLDAGTKEDAGNHQVESRSVGPSAHCRCPNRTPSRSVNSCPRAGRCRMAARLHSAMHPRPGAFHGCRSTARSPLAGADPRHLTPAACSTNDMTEPGHLLGLLTVPSFPDRRNRTLGLQLGHGLARARSPAARPTRRRNRTASSSGTPRSSPSSPRTRPTPTTCWLASSRTAGPTAVLVATWPPQARTEASRGGRSWFPTSRSAAAVTFSGPPTPGSISHPTVRLTS